MSRPDFMEAEALLDGHVTVTEIVAFLNRNGWEVTRALHGTISSTVWTGRGEDDESNDIEINHVPVQGPRGTATRVVADAFGGTIDALSELAGEFGGAYRADRRSDTAYEVVSHPAQALEPDADEALATAFERAIGPQAAADAIRAIRADGAVAEALREALESYASSAPAPR